MHFQYRNICICRLPEVTVYLTVPPPPTTTLQVGVWKCEHLQLAHAGRVLSPPAAPEEDLNPSRSDWIGPSSNTLIYLAIRYASRFYLFSGFYLLCVFILNYKQLLWGLFVVSLTMSIVLEHPAKVIPPLLFEDGFARGVFREALLN